MKKCKNADKYKAVLSPRCNNGQPCDTCVTKWNMKHPKLKFPLGGTVTKWKLKTGR